nr:stalk domain-containing protein [Paenibacillus artemisiicola]
MSLLLLSAAIPHAARAAAKPIRVYVDGEPLRFGGAQPVSEDGRLLVPFRALFETLGFTVQWTGSGGSGRAVGTKAGLKLELTIDSRVAKVNGKNATLDVPARVVRGSTLVPLRFVSENGGFRVDYESGGGATEIRIASSGGTGGNPGSAGGSAGDEPYVVKGRVVDEQGRPVEGAAVFADNQLLYNSNLTATTDANGNYRIELPRLATTWHMGGSYEAAADGETYRVDLTPANDAPFAGNTGAVRDFTLRKETAFGELYYYLSLDDIAAGYSEQYVEVALTPAGGGKAFAGPGFHFPGGFGRNDVPVGTYKATARYAPPGEQPVAMTVRVRNKGAYADSATFAFEELVPGVYQAELEMKLP